MWHSQQIVGPPLLFVTDQDGADQVESTPEIESLEEDPEQG